METKQFNSLLAIQKQKELCKEKGYPHFAPQSGRCWKCSRNIYSPIGWSKYEFGIGRRKQVELDSPELHSTTGITVEKASKELVTGCPHCNRSYCD